MKFGKDKTPKSKTVSKAKADKVEAVVEETVNLDKMVEDKKTSGTAFQAYMRDEIKRA